MASKFSEKMEDAISELIKSDKTDPDYICLNWLLISEWTDFEGNRYLHTEVSDAMTPWNAYGMMKLAEEYNSDVLRTKNIGTDDEEL